MRLSFIEETSVLSWFVWGSAHILGEIHCLCCHGGCNSSSTLFCVGSGSTPLCNMNCCSNSCLHFLFTLKQWFPLGICTLRCDLLTVQELCKTGCYLLGWNLSLLPISMCLFLAKYRKSNSLFLISLMFKYIIIQYEWIYLDQFDRRWNYYFFQSRAGFILNFSINDLPKCIKYLKDRKQN